MRITLQEYGPPVIHKLGNIELIKFTEANRRWRTILGLSSDPFRMEALGNGTYRLRAEAITGVVRIGDLDVEITPKFLAHEEGSWQTVLWRILTAVEGGVVDENFTSAHNSQALAIPDLLAEVFLASYAQGASRGLPRRYQPFYGNGHTLRGTLDISRLAEWFSHPWIIPYICDDLTDDTPLARLIRWSADCLAATVQSPSRARALREIAGNLAHVSRHPPRLIESQRISIGIQHNGLEAARLVGILLLEGAGVHHAIGNYALSGFLWNSDKIYERYVYWLCQRAANKRGMRIIKSEVIFGEVKSGLGSKLKTTPDVLFQNTQGVRVAVTDAKYKTLGLRPKASDSYQILTAAHALGCTKVSLTYPVGVDREPTVWSVNSALGGKTIALTALPLNLMNLVKVDGESKLVAIIETWLDNGC